MANLDGSPFIAARITEDQDNKIEKISTHYDCSRSEALRRCIVAASKGDLENGGEIKWTTKKQAERVKDAKLED